MAIKMKAREAHQYLQLTIDGGADPAVKLPAARDNPEQRTQIAVFAKRRVLLEKYPCLQWLYATLNGIFIPPAVLKQVADAGLVKGVLDLRMDVAHVEANGTRWSGLAIDLKSQEGRPTPEQLAWTQQLIAIGIRAVFCGGDKRYGLSPLADALATIYAYAGIAGEALYVTHEEEYRLADLLAAANVAKKQAQAEREARRLTKALKR